MCTATYSSLTFFKSSMNETVEVRGSRIQRGLGADRGTGGLSSTGEDQYWHRTTSRKRKHNPRSALVDAPFAPGLHRGGFSKAPSQSPVTMRTYLTSPDLKLSAASKRREFGGGWRGGRVRSDAKVFSKRLLVTLGSLTKTPRS